MNNWTLSRGIADTRYELSRIPTMARRDWRNFKRFAFQQVMEAVVNLVEHPLLNLLRVLALVLFVGMVLEALLTDDVAR